MMRKIFGRFDLKNCDKEESIKVAFVCDMDYLMQTSVAIHSLRKTLANKFKCEIAVLLTESDSSGYVAEWAARISTDLFRIYAIEVDITDLEKLHEFDENSICVATPAALAKFILAEVLSDWDKVLYLDGDIIVKDDIRLLWETDFEGNLAAVVVDSGSIYNNFEFLKRFDNYFNSGVMLLNLTQMREAHVAEALVQTKATLRDSSLMDQNVFNLVFDGAVKLLPIRWNCLFVNLSRATALFEIDELNQRYATSYDSLNQLAEDAAIIHYSSKDKPWIAQNAPLHELWYSWYLTAKGEGTLFSRPARMKGLCAGGPIISVLMSVNNAASHLEEAIESILTQTLQNFELICVDYGSTDESANILDVLACGDSRMKVCHTKK